MHGLRWTVFPILTVWLVLELALVQERSYKLG